MSPLRKHPSETPGKRDKGRRRKGKGCGRELLLSPATHLGPPVYQCPSRDFLGLASPAKVDFPHPAYGSTCVRVLSCQGPSPGYQRQESTAVQVGPYRTFWASYVWQGPGPVWCGIHAIAEDATLPSPRKLLSCLDFSLSRSMLETMVTRACAFPENLATEPTPCPFLPWPPHLTCFLLCPQELWSPRTMDTINRNQVGPGCKTPAMVQVSVVGGRASGLLVRMCRLLYLGGPSPRMTAVLPLLFPRSQAY